MNMNKMQKMIPAILLTAVLGACGGGGGSSTPAPAPAPTGAVTPTNYGGVGHVGYSSGLTFNFYSGRAVASAVQANVNPSTFDLNVLVEQQLSEAMQIGFQPAIAVGATVTQTLSCTVSGTYTVTLNDADGNAALSAGDSLTSVYNNCVSPSASGNFTRNGTVASTFTKIVGDSSIPNSNYQLGLNISFQNVVLNLPATATSTSVVNVNGSMTSDTAINPTGISTATTTIPSFTLSGGPSSFNYTNYQLSLSVNNVTHTYTKSAQGMLNDSIAGTYNISTPIPFQGTVGGNPSVGQLKIEGASAFAYVTAIDTFSAKLDLDNGKDGSTDATQTVAWSAL
jgi:hypothetical protein